MNADKYYDSLKPEIEMPTADEVVYNILNNQVSDYDYSTWKSFTDKEQAECFREIVGIWASRGKQGDIDRVLARIDITSYLEASLLGAAKAEGYK